jgi:hypothetical protein
MKITDLQDYHVLATGVPKTKKPSATETIKDVGIGFAKGAGETVSTIQNLGRGVMAAVDPTRTYGEIKSQYGIQALDDKEMLKADNNAQKAGKAVEFLAEVLFPAGAVSKSLGITEKASKVVGASFDGVGSRIASIADDGSKIKDKIVDLIGGLDDKTKTALKRTPKETFDSIFKQGKDAMVDDRNRTPLEAVGDDIISGLKQVKERAGSIGEAKSQIMETAGVGYKKAGNIAQKTALDVQKAFSGMKLDPSDSKVVQEFQKTLMDLGDNPRLKDIDATIDLLQDRLYKSTRSNVLDVTDRITGRLQEALGKLNSQVKTLGGDAYSKANQDYSELIQVVRELNARLGKEGASAGSFVKRLFSPSDARTKELFEQLQKYTGKDYVRDARLAKFIMEALGDTRAKTLLEEIPTSAKGALDKGINYVVNKISDPISAAERFIKKNGPK